MQKCLYLCTLLEGNTYVCVTIIYIICILLVLGPTQSPIQPKIFDYNNGVFRVEFNAFEVGMILNIFLEIKCDFHSRYRIKLFIGNASFHE